MTGSNMALTYLSLLGGAYFQTLLLIPSDYVYLLQASIPGLPKEPLPVRWSVLSSCGVDELGRNANCNERVYASYHAAISSLVSSTNNETVLDDASLWHYELVFQAARFCVILSLGWAVYSFLCAPLLSFFWLPSDEYKTIMAALNGTFFFQSLAAPLFTFWIFKTQSLVHNAGLEAHIGWSGLRHVWAAWICYLVTFISRGNVMRKQRDDDYQPIEQLESPVGDGTLEKSGDKHAEDKSH